MRIGIVALAAVGLITPTYAQKRATKTQPAVPYSTRYSNSVAGITCENATARLAGVMSDEPILNRIPALKTAQYLATKGEFETTADYVAKQAAELRALFGTTKTVVVTRSLDSISKYNADTGVLTIKVFSPRIGEEAEPAYHFGEVIDVKERGKYVASNAYGATATVSKSSWSVSQYGFDTLPNGALMELTLPVKGEAARAAKTHGDRKSVV